MDELSDEIRGARRKLLALVQITRSLWVANAVVLLAAVVYSRVEVAVLAGFTLVLALVGAAMARGASGYLREAIRTMRATHQ
jgi:hypothetical protein